MQDEVKTTCPYCGVGCGVIISATQEAWAVGGDPDHPANKGRLCSKGAALIDSLDAEAERDFRLLFPNVDGVDCDWDRAIAEMAGRLRETIDRHGPKSVAFYVSGQLLTEDYYVANKLIKGFIGSPHIDTNSRLCMASTVVGHKRAFGADVVPGCYEDLELADLVILTGSNLAWCHPVLYQRLRAAKAVRGTKVVVIDPRRTASCDIADLHLAIRPGSDVALFNGLLTWVDDNGLADWNYLTRHVGGYAATVASAREDCPTVEQTAMTCGLEAKDLRTLYRWFAECDKTVTVFSQGVNQSSQGSDKVNAILNCHLATGRVGKPGSGPFSVTGQPNAMGGREVGGLANQLAAHMDPNDPMDVDRLRRFWKAPNLRQGEGYKAVELFRAVERGEIKALWVMGTNPAVSLPDTNRVRGALEICPLVIASDVVRENDTLRYADIVLPAAAWSEKSGTVTNSERRISRQRAFRKAPGSAKPDWWIMSQVAQVLGFEKAFSYRDPAEIFAEFAALSEFENDGIRAFDIGQWSKARKGAYDSMEPFQWPASRDKSRPADVRRLYTDGCFTTNNGRANMLAVRQKEPRALADGDYPLIANTGRYRDQWHTMTRTGPVARLAAHRPEPLLEIHPKDAAHYGLVDGGLARVESQYGNLLMRVSVTEAQAAGAIFMPMHWSDSFSSDGGIGRLVPPETDPHSGQPESKLFPVRIGPYQPMWQGLLFSRQDIDLSGLPYWVKAAAPGCLIYEIAGDVPHIFRSLLGPHEEGQIIEYSDRQRGVTRLARLVDDQVASALFAAPDRPVLDRNWIASLFGGGALDEGARAGLLVGRTASGTGVSDRLICSCYSVGLAAITDAIQGRQAISVEELGRLLQAGTGCGSCLSELKEIVDETVPRAAE